MPTQTNGFGYTAPTGLAANQQAISVKGLVGQTMTGKKKSTLTPAVYINGAEIAAAGGSLSLLSLGAKAGDLVLIWSTYEDFTPTGGGSGAFNFISGLPVTYSYTGYFYWKIITDPNQNLSTISTSYNKILMLYRGANALQVGPFQSLSSAGTLGTPYTWTSTVTNGVKRILIGSLQGASDPVVITSAGWTQRQYYLGVGDIFHYKSYDFDNGIPLPGTTLDGTKTNQTGVFTIDLIKN